MIGFLAFLFGLGYLDEAQQQQRQPRTSAGEWVLAILVVAVFLGLLWQWELAPALARAW
jgi:hypothetical protein